MVQIIQDLIPKGRRNRPGHKLDPKYITIHDTANTQTGADAKAHAAYVKSTAAANIPASWHFTVDDKVIYQHLPLKENGWHAGDGTNGTGNRQSIGIEICENRDGNRAAAEANAAWLAAKLIKEVNTLKPFPACMKQHYDWSKKNCPAQIRGRKNGWANFLAAVESHLKTEAEITRPIGIYVDGKKADEVGYLIDNATYVRASYLIALIGGSVTGHGDHINIVLPMRPDPAVVEKLRTDLAAANKKIEAARRALGA
ncbi:peptidoglycan recognition protein family protein [Candidatus Darwinibacter acetoxidans]